LRREHRRFRSPAPQDLSGYVGIYNMISPAIGRGNPTLTVFKLPK
jgi:hypothetical protein